MENPLWSYIFKRSREGEENLFSILQKIPIFEGLPKRDLRWIEQIIHIRHYNRNEVIFAEDEPGVGLYIISKGAVKIFKRDVDGKETVLAILNQGQFFGEMALLEDVPRTATAVATETSVLLGFFHPDLMGLIDRKPALGCKILLRLARLVGERLRKTNELLQ